MSSRAHALARPSMAKADAVEPLCDAVCSEVARCLALARTVYKIAITMPEIRFDLRGRSAGQARFNAADPNKAPVLRFNATLLCENPDAFLAEVPAHECAHLVVACRWRHKVRPHGVQWQRVMQELYGLEPRVTHKMAVAPSTRKKFAYRCACAGSRHLLGSIRHARIQSGKSAYFCRRCGCSLRPHA